MSISSEKRTTIIDHLRVAIGDEDKRLFDDAQLDSYLRARVYAVVRTEILTARKKHYYPIIQCPVIDLDITSGTADQMYRIDENSKVVAWTSGSAEPADGHTITISYLDLNFMGTIRDTLLIIATDRARLALRSKVGEIETDTRIVRAEIMKQIQALAVIENWENRSGN